MIILTETKKKEISNYIVVLFEFLKTSRLQGEVQDKIIKFTEDLLFKELIQLPNLITDIIFERANDLYEIQADSELTQVEVEDFIWQFTNDIVTLYNQEINKF